MNHREFIARDKEARAYFDTIDFLKFMSDEKCISVRDLMDALEEYYNYKDFLPAVFEGLLFNYTSEEEFANYLENRYGFRVRCEITTSFYITR